MPHEAAGEGVMVTLAVVKTLVLLVGGVVTYYSVKAYRRTGDQSLGLLAAGFGIVTLGAFFGGVVNEVLNVVLAVGVIVEGLFMLLGFALIAYSLRVT